MSLVISISTPEGIVVAADTRTTITCGDDIRFNDTARKIVPFPNKTVVCTYGDGAVGDHTVYEFLVNIRKKYGETVNIGNLPTIILSECLNAKGSTAARFLVSGLVENIYPVIFYVDPGNQEIRSCIAKKKTYAAISGGCDMIAAPILQSVDFSDLSIQEAIDLAILTVKTTIDTAKYWVNHPVGGEVKIYVIDRVNDVSGWYDLETKRVINDLP